MDGGVAATEPCPRRMHYTIVVKPDAVEYSFYNTNKYKIKDFNDMFSRKFFNFGKRLQIFNEYMFQKLGLFQGIVNIFCYILFITKVLIIFYLNSLPNI